MAAVDIGRCDYGDTPSIYFTTSNDAEALVSATSVVVKTQSPAGTETTYTSPNAALTNPELGVWKFTFPSAVTIAGEWFVRFKATAGVLDAREFKFTVEPTEFASP